VGSYRNIFTGCVLLIGLTTLCVSLVTRLITTLLSVSS